MFTEDLSLFLGDFAKPVAANGVNGYGIFDAPGEYLGPDGMMLIEGERLRCLSSEFGGLTYDDLITVDGVQYAVRDNRPIHDGVFCLLLLTKVAAAAENLITTLSGLNITTLAGVPLRTL